jgi:hypothetical protein
MHCHKRVADLLKASPSQTSGLRNGLIEHLGVKRRLLHVIFSISQSASKLGEMLMNLHRSRFRYCQEDQLLPARFGPMHCHVFLVSGVGERVARVARTSAYSRTSLN